MVEEEEDISKVDVSSLKTEAAAPAKEAPAQAPPKQEAQQPKPSASAAASGAASAVGTEAFLHELEEMLHGDKYLVAPAAAFYMRTYRVLPSEVEATGPKGRILRGDVLEFVEKNKIEKGRARDGSAGSGKKAADAPKKAAKKDKAAGGAAQAGGAYDPAHPFKQSWEDLGLPSGYG